MKSARVVKLSKSPHADQTASQSEGLRKLSKLMVVQTSQLEAADIESPWKVFRDESLSSFAAGRRPALLVICPCLALQEKEVLSTALLSTAAYLAHLSSDSADQRFPIPDSLLQSLTSSRGQGLPAELLDVLPDPLRKALLELWNGRFQPAGSQATGQRSSSHNSQVCFQTTQQRHYIHKVQQILCKQMCL